MDWWSEITHWLEKPALEWNSPGSDYNRGLDAFLNFEGIRCSEKSTDIFGKRFGSHRKP